MLEYTAKALKHMGEGLIKVEIIFPKTWNINSQRTLTGEKHIPRLKQHHVQWPQAERV